MPRLNRVGFAGYTAGDVDAFGRRGTLGYSVGPVISWPAFDLGRVKARARYEQVTMLAREQGEDSLVR